MYEFTTERGLSTTISEDRSTGDAIIRQHNSTLFAHYDYWPHILLHGIFFCFQSGLPIPNPFNLSTQTRGINNTSGEPVILLQSAHYRSKHGKKIIIPIDTEKNSLDLQVSSDNKFDFNPKISGGNLIYTGEDNTRFLTFSPKDMPQFFQGVTEPMMRNVRGTKPRLDAVYSEFPWDFYKTKS
jgi:hypothetical protein